MRCTFNKNRAPKLSLLQGIAFAGAAPAYVVGGLITKQFGGVVCLTTSCAILLFISLYTIFVVHETLGEPQLDEVLEEEEEEFDRHRHDGVLPRVINLLASVVAPLKYLIPRKDLVTGRRNPRLLLFAVALFMASVGSSYLTAIVIVYGTTMFEYGPADVRELSVLAAGTCSNLACRLEPF